MVGLLCVSRIRSDSIRLCSTCSRSDVRPSPHLFVVSNVARLERLAWQPYICRPALAKYWVHVLMVSWCMLAIIIGYVREVMMLLNCTCAARALGK